MNFYIITFILLVLLNINFLLTQKTIPSKYRPLPIVSHLLGSLIIIPIVLFFLKNQLQINIPTISSESFLKNIQNLLGALVLGFILLELSHVKPTKKILKVSILSYVFPILGAVIVCLFLDKLSNIQLTIALMCVFAISAVPILYLYLKQFNVDNETVTVLMGAAILIDIIAWLTFGFISSTFSLTALILCTLLGFIPIAISNIIKGADQKTKRKIIGLLFFSIFLFLYLINTYALIFAIIYLISVQKININIENFIPSSLLHNFFNYFAIPLLFIFASFSISLEKVLNEINLTEFSLLFFAPIIFKVFGSWLGLKSIGWEKAWFGAWLLNTRGLTEIVFLNILLSSNIINTNQYLSLLLMSLVSTVIPGLIKNKI